MLYIVLTDGSEEHWHVGDDEPKSGEFVSDVMGVQADGHELAFVREQFKGLPDTNRAVVCWFGDHAKFIVAHLRKI